MAPIDVQLLHAQLQAMPFPMLVAVAMTAVVAVMFAVRIISNTFHGSSPPVDEGIPFVGGLMKFSKVGDD